jgi:hypothetical protein
VFEFTGGVSGKSEFDFRCRNSAAIVADLNALTPISAQANADMGRPSVERVFEHFLDYRCWTLDHLPSGNLGDDLIGENMNWHESPPDIEHLCG